VLDDLRGNDQVLFRYSSAEGATTNDFNPNGAVDNIAGVCNKGMNVFGMMPHPERAADEILGNTDGRLILDSLIGNLFGEEILKPQSVSM
jgi:phosphoribosylformylglycinamidine synthase